MPRLGLRASMATFQFIGCIYMVLEQFELFLKKIDMISHYFTLRAKCRFSTQEGHRTFNRVTSLYRRCLHMIQFPYSCFISFWVFCYKCFMFLAVFHFFQVRGRVYLLPLITLAFTYYSLLTWRVASIGFCSIRSMTFEQQLQARLTPGSKLIRNNLLRSSIFLLLA